MELKKVLVLAGLFYVFISCNEQTDDPEKNIIKKDVFSGYVQKGPFNSGSSISIQELDANLDQTGRSYITTIIDNTGSFEQKKIELISGYVQLKADGYFFNEVTGYSTISPITLFALADIAGSNKANINVLTHLERARVEFLVKETGMKFADAKRQALEEVLSIFNLSLPEEAASETFSLTSSATLLAVSCILQGFLSTADMAELMANISADIRTDGKLKNLNLGTKLIDNALLVPLSAVRLNMERKYAGLGTDIRIPDFERLVSHFIENTAYKPTDRNSIPEDSILIFQPTYKVLHGPCGSITYIDKVGNDYKTALEALSKRGDNLQIHLNSLKSGYRIESEIISVDFNYDDRIFYSIGFVANDFSFSRFDVIDSKGNYYYINWCDD